MDPIQIVLLIILICSLVVLVVCATIYCVASGKIHYLCDYKNRIILFIIILISGDDSGDDDKTEKMKLNIFKKLNLFINKNNLDIYKIHKKGTLKNKIRRFRKKCVLTDIVIE